MSTALELFDSACVIAALALLFGVVRRLAISARSQDLLLGAAFGAGAVVSMLQPILVVGPLIVDCRTLFIGFSAAFLGIEGALAAFVVAASGRLMVGMSVEALLGLGALTLSTAGGWLWKLRMVRLKQVLLRYGILGFMVSTPLLTLFLLPNFRGLEGALASVAALLAFNVTGSVLLGGILTRESGMLDREARANLAAATDPLTGVLNRRGFLARFSEAESREKQRGSAFLLIDLDHFKQVNDTLGHEAGDRVICAASERIQSMVRPQDSVMRVGGEEFGVLLSDVDQGQSERLAERLRSSLAMPLVLAGFPPMNITASIGGHCWGTGSRSLEDVSRWADRALYAAKAGGRDRAVFQG